MPTKKAPEHDKTLMEKIGEQASHLKEEIIAGKDHLVEAAENKIAAVKETIKKYQDRRKKAAKKVAKKVSKKAVKKVAKKAVTKVLKKAARKVVKKVAKKAARPAKKTPAKKSAKSRK